MVVILISILIAILVFGVLIFIHELGHFFTAKKAGVLVSEFAIGMGPAIFKKQKGETLYSLRLFPFGGFCQMEGEDLPSDSDRSFNQKPLYQRAIILLAGSAMNILLGYVIILCMLSFQPTSIATSVGQFKWEESSSQTSGMMVGDKILKIDGSAIRSSYDIIFFLGRYKGEEFDTLVERNGERIVLENMQFPYEELDMSEITGSAADEGTVYRHYKTDFLLERVDNNFLLVIKDSFFRSIYTAKTVWFGIFDLISGGASVKDLSGPVGITSAIGQASEKGSISDVLSLVVMLAINLGIVNLLPLPALDGGRLMFLLFEAVTKRRCPEKIEYAFNAVGFVLLMGLVLIVTFNDVIRYILN